MYQKTTLGASKGSRIKFKPLLRRGLKGYLRRFFEAFFFFFGAAFFFITFFFFFAFFFFSFLEIGGGLSTINRAEIINKLT
ncbi:hypothetical protein M1432_01060 [Patescibacteria group bacterium]|nr:hypothetical protein [Patescibacteria group bacterium]